LTKPEKDEEAFNENDTNILKRNVPLMLVKEEKRCHTHLPYKLTEQQVRNQKTLRTKRTTTVISPFSERRSSYDDIEIGPISQPMPLQTTGGFFKGKPPITPFTRLGCFRMQSNRTINFSTKTSTVEKRHCFTADAPQMVNSPQLERRPASHVPQRNGVQPNGSEMQRPTPPLLNSSVSRHAKDIYKENNVHTLPIDRFPFVGATNKSQNRQQRHRVILYSTLF